MMDAGQHGRAEAGSGTNASQKDAPARFGIQLPGSVGSRLLTLFLALGLIKLILVCGLRRHLQEIHWRITDYPVHWTNWAAFGLFVGVGVLSLIGLGRQCQRQGHRAVRAANAVVVGLGLLFVFLTFHEGDKNYLYPVMTGTLGWRDLWPYLSLNLFFRAPYLALWLVGYGFGYYLLVRQGREHRALHLTAAFAGAYAVVALREFIQYHNELMVAVGMGFPALQNLRRSSAAIPSIWLLLPVGWTVFAWGMFNWGLPDAKSFNPYFPFILGESLAVFGAMTLFAWRRGFFRAWAFLLPFGFTAFLLFANVNYYPLAVNYNNVLCYALVFPHYFLGELWLTGAVGGVALIYCRRCPRRSLWWLDVLILGLIALAFVDLRLTQIMGVRLEWDLLALGNSPKMMWRMARPYLPEAAAGFGVVVLLYTGLVRSLSAAWGANGQGVRRSLSDCRGWYVGASFLALGIVGTVLVKPDKATGTSVVRLVKSHPVWKHSVKPPWSQDEFIRASQSLGLGNLVVAAPPAASPLPRRDLNVLLVFMESSYNKHLSLFGGGTETQPLLSQYKDRMELFPNFFATFASSIHARWAAFTSLYPVADFDLFTQRKVPVKSLFDVLHAQGYTCSMFYSSFFDYTGFRDFLNQHQLDAKYDADTMPGLRQSPPVSWGVREEETLGAMREQIRKYAAGHQRFFLTYVPAAPHYPYDALPERFRKFKSGVVGDYTPLYLNELLYMDWVIASILEQLKDSGLLDQTLVIITDDHGEMLGGPDGAVGHGWAVTPELANVPLIIMDPAKPGFRINRTVGSHLDLLPTVLDVLGLPLPMDQFYQGRSLYAPAPATGLRTYLNSYQQYAVILGDRIVIGDRAAENGGANASAQKAYAITNVETKTVFLPVLTQGQSPVAIQPLDEFQENLLRNYGHYMRIFRPPPATNSLPAKP